MKTAAEHESVWRKGDLLSAYRINRFPNTVFDLEPAWTHDLSLEDKQFESARSRSKDLAECCSFGVGGQSRFYSLQPQS